ncbi:MAG: thioredoxin family protein [Candidatus Aenigmatarchaeota archaeon]
MKEVILVKTKWCPYCPSASTLWKELSKKYKFNYKEVDAASSEGQELVSKFNIMAVPTTIIDGKVAFVGVPSREKAEQAIKS